MKPIWLGISAGVLVSLVFGLVYFVVLREPGSTFYLFAGLTLLGGSLIGGLIALGCFISGNAHEVIRY